MTTTPHTTSYHCDRISESRQVFCVPGRRAHRFRLAFDQAIGQQGDQRKQSKKDRSCTCDRQITPLSQRLHTEMSPRCFESSLHPPTAHEPRQDLQWRMVGIRTEKRLWLP